MGKHAHLLVAVLVLLASLAVALASLVQDSTAEWTGLSDRPQTAILWVIVGFAAAGLIGGLGQWLQTAREMRARRAEGSDPDSPR